MQDWVERGGLKICPWWRCIQGFFYTSCPEVMGTVLSRRKESGLLLGQVSQRAEHQPSIHTKKKRRMELLETPVGEGDSHRVTGVIWKFRAYLALGSRVLQENC